MPIIAHWTVTVWKNATVLPVLRSCLFHPHSHQSDRTESAFWRKGIQVAAIECVISYNVISDEECEKVTINPYQRDKGSSGQWYSTSLSDSTLNFGPIQACQHWRSPCAFGQGVQYLDFLPCNENANYMSVIKQLLGWVESGSCNSLIYLP